MLTAVAIVFVFGLLILFHEFGHYAVAKLNGIKVLEFSFGFGPKLLGIKRSDTLYAIRLIPLGGYVKLYGMDQETDENGKPIIVALDDPDSYMSKKVWQRASVIAAGSIMNFVLAILLFVIIFVTYGIPTSSNEPIIGSVIEGMPAHEAGIEAGTKIIAVNDEEVSDWASLTAKIWENPNKEIKLTVEKDNQQMMYTLTPELDEETGHGMIGISPSVVYEPASFGEAVSYGVERTVAFTKYILVTLGQMITGETKAEVGGPVMIAQAIGEGAKQGLPDLLSLTGILSIQLGLLNLLPIPALDGSKLIFLGIEGVRGKPVSLEKENFIHFIGFILLMALMVAVTYKDIVNLFK